MATTQPKALEGARIQPGHLGKTIIVTAEYEQGTAVRYMGRLVHAHQITQPNGDIIERIVLEGEPRPISIQDMNVEIAL
jgi:hypothetical protein